MRALRYSMWWLLCCALVAGCSEASSYRELVKEAAVDIDGVQSSSLLSEGYLVVPMYGYASTLNPLRISTPFLATWLANALYPHVFEVQQDGSTALDKRYFTSAFVESKDPQVVSLTINHEAVWSDGTPITWRDIQCQADLLSGKNANSDSVRGSGFDRIASVSRGVDDREAVITFKADGGYHEWEGLFTAPYVLLPCSTTSDEKAFFSNAHMDAVTAGPYVISGANETAGQIILTRNPRWWGPVPHLDGIVLSKVKEEGQHWTPNASFIRVWSDDDLVWWEGSTFADIRSSDERGWASLVFNTDDTDPSSDMADVELRRAIALAIDQEALAVNAFRGLTTLPAEQDSNVVVDELGQLPSYMWHDMYNPVDAASELDKLGWKLDGDFRVKDDQPLVLDVATAYVNTLLTDALREQLRRVGIELKLVDTWDQFSESMSEIDAALTVWAPDVFPLRRVYQYLVDPLFQAFQCCGPQVDKMIAEAAVATTDDEMYEALGQVDRYLWEEARVLPLTQIPEVFAVAKRFANVGAFGVADVDFTEIGIRETMPGG